MFPYSSPESGVWRLEAGGLGNQPGTAVGVLGLNLRRGEIQLLKRLGVTCWVLVIRQVSFLCGLRALRGRSFYSRSLIVVSERDGLRQNFVRVVHLRRQRSVFRAPGVLADFLSVLLFNREISVGVVFVSLRHAARGFGDELPQGIADVTGLRAAGLLPGPVPGRIVFIGVRKVEGARGGVGVELVGGDDVEIGLAGDGRGAICLADLATKNVVGVPGFVAQGSFEWMRRPSPS